METGRHASRLTALQVVFQNARARGALAPPWESSVECGTEERRAGRGRAYFQDQGGALISGMHRMRIAGCWWVLFDTNHQKLWRMTVTLRWLLMDQGLHRSSGLVGRTETTRALCAGTRYTTGRSWLDDR